jgi:membrane protease YdiL (CAAX protease family)
MVTTVFSIGLAGTVIFGWLGLPDDLPAVQFVQGMSYHILLVFILVPFVLHLPKGKRTFRQYLSDIGLSRMQPFFRLVLLALSCYIILALSQVTASFVYRLFEGQPIRWGFLRLAFDLSRDLPPGSPSLLISIPSIFEEVAFRGIVLTVFLSKYSESKSIFFSSISFGLMHLLNLTNGRELVWVMGQVVWSFTIGLFYGYIFVRTHSLLPAMIVHYLGNVFISSLTGYIQSRASIEIQVLYGVIFSLGFVPATLMIVWTRYFSSRWLPVRVDQKEHIDGNHNQFMVTARYTEHKADF